MTIPLIILAVLSIATGYLGIPEFLGPMFERDGGNAHASRSAMASCCWQLRWDCSASPAAYYVYVLNPSLAGPLGPAVADGV